MIRFRILCLFLLNLFFMHAYTQEPFRNYDPNWKKVDELVKKGLPKSALAEVKKIYGSAKKEKQDAQVIRALIYTTFLQQETREDNLVMSIRELEKEITRAPEPSASVLKSLAAELYWDYFQINRWKFYDRTNTVNFRNEDINTWTRDDLHKKITALYLSSVRQVKLLEETKLEPYDAIIIKGNTRKLRPTLYDLLAHRALGYFKNDERDISRPAYAFEISQAEAFAPARDFIRVKFITNDTSSLHHKALLIFQDLMAFHIQQRNADALTDVDIERLEFVRQFSVHPDKENLYRKALTLLAGATFDYPAVDQAKYLLAQYYETLAAQYKPYGDTSYRLYRVMARDLCEKVIKRKEDTEGKINCYNLLRQLHRQELQFDIEKVNSPGLPFRALVSYRNFTRLYWRLIKPDEKLKQQLENQYDEKYWSKLLSATAVKSWQQALPATGDLQTHYAEVKIDALPAGDYVLIAGTQNDFNDKKTVLGARIVYVSSISYVNNGNDFFVLNRETGQPMANAAVQRWEQKYDSRAGQHVKEKTGSYTTDKNGFFSMKKNGPVNSSNNYFLDISYNNERLFMNEPLNHYYYEREDENDRKPITTAWLFTDRGIYRPGQTVYFKGIVTGKKSPLERTAVRVSYQTIIYLKNANDETVDSLPVKTNEYGSFSGKFQLPQNTLNGGFSLAMKNDEGHANIQVEEYKRPKFSVEFEKIKGSYAVNDSIRVQGSARAYAGNNIDNAIVKYRVVRKPRFHYPFLFRKWWQPPVREMEIGHGELKTDKNGKFNLVFSAIPDLSIEKKLDPVFDYTVYADITDINGETRSGETNVSAGYKSLVLQVDIPSSLPADSLLSISVRTENMNGEFEPAIATVTITRLKEEKRLIRNRYWERPDQFVMNREEYIRNFPYDEYDGENDFENWEKGEKVFEKQDAVHSNAVFTIGSRSQPGWKSRPGIYLVEVFTKDKEGREIKDEKYIELYNDKNRQLGRPRYLWTAGSKPIEPGEKTSITVGSSAGNLFLIQETERQSVAGGTSRSYLSLSNEKKTIEFTATEADRGGYGISYLFVKNNRFYQTAQPVQVPWTNKELTVEYATFRDKTLPGSEEKWKLKISGYRHEKVAAEMLASLYDASLDQLYPFDWNRPYLWPYYNHTNRWNGTQDFESVQSFQQWIKEDGFKNFKKEYDRFISDDHSMLGYGPAGGISMKRMAVPAMANQQLAEAAISDSVETDKMAAAKPEETKPGETRERINNPVQVRKNFNETAFFFPDLRTDSGGAVEFSFTLPEALTTWKFQALLHTKDLALGLSSKTIVTQKQLMVQPNVPRFLREGDRMELSAKIVNLTDKEITGQAALQLFDASTNQSVDGWFQNMYPNQFFTVAAGQSEVVQFPIQAPYLFNKALTWRIVARSNDLSDGEEASLPILTNKTLVTETLPINMRGTGNKKIKFDKLLKSSESETLQHQALTVEYTLNPAWYAVQALPYLMEYPYDCAEQTWNRYYANSLASLMINSSPLLKKIIAQWKAKDTAAFQSNLQKNPELKAVLLQETPWVLEAKTEEQQKKNIALLFDLARMSSEMNTALEKLKQLQLDNGGFAWFNGGADDRYMTQYIVTGIGHLKKLNAFATGQESKLRLMLSTAIPYLDKKMKADYDALIKQKTDLEKFVPGATLVQYLYMRSFFPDYKIAAASQSAYNYFRQRVQKSWQGQRKYVQGMIALTLSRTGDTKTPAAILKSLKETAIIDEESGMYWQNQRNGWFWYEAPVETQALLIETFAEAGNDRKTVEDLKTWLLKNKQTNNWKTTKATAEACYALLMQGSSWLTNGPEVTISLGSTQIKSTDEQQEAGTGYLKKTIPGDKINPGMGNISVTLTHDRSVPDAGTNNPPTWGAVYWQYFEDLDKITGAATPLKISKKLFVEKNSDHGPVLSPVPEGGVIKVGDKIKVRVELRVDRDMEYVHMKDMRAGSLEPVNVLSEYKWQGGLGYYETTKDASTNFFFSNLRKGTYVFEYALFATHKGNFSNGITSVQCMYAPEFASHSEGVRITVE